MLLKRHAASLSGLLIIVTSYAMSRLPTLDADTRTQLAGRYSFTPYVIPRQYSGRDRLDYRVNHTLHRIASFISAAGVGLAFNDLDGDGMPNDYCHVEPRDGHAVVGPVPGTGDRFAPIILKPTASLFDPISMEIMGCLPGDLNEDGEMDIVLHFAGRTPIAFLRHGDQYVSHELLEDGRRWFTSSGSLADVNGDGHADLIFGNFYPDNAQTMDERRESDERMPHSATRAFNGGHNRILLWSGMDERVPARPIYRDSSEVMKGVAATGWTIGVGAADLDGDMLPEIYFANDFGTDRLLHNRTRDGKLEFALLEGKRDFFTPTSKRVGRDSYKGMGIEFNDFNRDGYLDMFVSNIGAPFAFVESHFAFLSTGETSLMTDGHAPYKDHSEQLGLSRSSWSWDIKLGDFDNDGTMEVVQTTGFIKGDEDRWAELQEYAMGNDETSQYPAFWPRFRVGDDIAGHESNPFFVRDAQGYYHDLAREIGIDQAYVSRGVALADVDGDGDLDFAYANHLEDSVYFRNDSKSQGAFLGLRLMLPISGDTRAGVEVLSGRPPVKATPAVGATVTLDLPNGGRWVAQVDGGNGHSGKRSNNLHFGLGSGWPAGEVDITVRWRDRQGRLRTHALSLAPGWHTLILGGPKS